MNSKVGAIAALGLSFTALAGTYGPVKVIDLGPTTILDLAGYSALNDHGELAGYTFPDSQSRAAYSGHVTVFGSLGGDYAQAIADYIEAAGLTSGPLFRPRLNSRSQKLANTSIGTRTMFRLIQSYLARIPGAHAPVQAHDDCEEDDERE